MAVRLSNIRLTFRYRKKGNEEKKPVNLKAAITGAIGIISLSGCFSEAPSSYGSTNYTSPANNRSGGNYHGSYVSPPPGYYTPSPAPRRSTPAGDPGKPFQFPKFEVENPGSTCGYPRTDCYSTPDGKPGNTRPSRPGYGATIPA